ncbi:hypothetical protein [Lederbergia galactosidilytica]|uniref:hypothetical protein n=1 Tax=Lederbergia galactosidilytica TaxID=217031 RepID=UPI000A841F8E|nr:hypothetical protein [Lederbergia galactosidilytica]
MSRIEELQKAGDRHGRAGKKFKMPTELWLSPKLKEVSKSVTAASLDSPRNARHPLKV